MNPTPPADQPQSLSPLTDLAAAADDWDEENLAEKLPADQEQRWRAGQRVRVEDYLHIIPGLSRYEEVVFDLIHNEFLLREELGESLQVASYLDRFPHYRQKLEALFAFRAEPVRPLKTSTRDWTPDDPVAEPQLVVPGIGFPSKIGRYPILSEINSGGFGVVYRGWDDRLVREVAIKMPRGGATSTPQQTGAFLAEARILASLDHRGIVPVYDFGQTDDGRCYLVSKLFQGGSLAERLASGRPSHKEAADLVAAAAEALHHAHQRGLVHRDIKPANILLEADGRPVVADFGLALREEDYGTGPGFAGTPAYMSPEQARGEGHLVDARTDVYSLGLVLYELLTGKNPHHAGTRHERRERLLRREPRPPRQIDDTIPRELDRVCMKALEKRAADRHSTALDLAEDLKQWSAGVRASPVDDPPRPAPPPAPPGATPAVVPPSSSDTVSDAVVPRGLRSYEAEDADFFLSLLPGPRSRGGIPECVRFWKTLLEATDADQTFRVGLIYGPSGCGKSSLVKAGLLPRLAGYVASVYIEAGADDTEARLLRNLRKRWPALPGGATLAESLAHIRRGRELLAGSKLVVVIDQFEQWLHAHAGESGGGLVDALRQCDGGKVQALLLVRDDFWMGISRFMRELEVPLSEGRNCAPIDLFTPRHARKVLAAFGRAFAALPEGELSPDQERFLEQAVAGLAEGGKVIPVRLALFAEMVKGKPWTSATWHDLGGADGVGVAFLEETFAARTAPPHHRAHQRAARAVLQRLLPAPGADLKGPMQSRGELLEASGYSGQPGEFESLLAVLDGELRLLTATDRESAGPPADSSGGSDRYYQLTHDYLVPALRQWLTRRQRETRRGRAELRLAERSAVWAAKPESRHLPSGWEWARIRLFTHKRDWTAPQRAMMRQAARHHLTRTAVAAAFLLLLAWGGWEYLAHRQAHELHRRLLGATVPQVPGLVDEIAPHRSRLEPLLREELARAEAENDSTKRRIFSLALLPWDRGEIDYLRERMLEASPEEFGVIREQLARYDNNRALTDWLWGATNDVNSNRRFRAACALAAYDRDDSRWSGLCQDVVGKLVTESSLARGYWVVILQPVAKHLLPILADTLKREKDDVRFTCAYLYRDFAGEDATAFEPLERFASDEQQDAPPERKTELLRQRANVAAALVAMDRGTRVWPLLKHTSDPTLRSYLIEKIPTSGVTLKTLEKRLNSENDVTIRRAIILAMESSSERSVEAERKLLNLYENDPDPGIHGVAECVLRKWQREKEIEAITQRLATGKVEGNRLWLVNKMQQTLVIVSATADRKIGRPFAMAAKEVTVADFARFSEEWLKQPHRYSDRTAPSPDCPVNSVSWYKAAHFCNWLSYRDGIEPNEWCYEPNDAGEYAEGMKVPRDYLSRKGYRLPTVAEREFAALAGAATEWACGDVDQNVLARYAWFDPDAGGRSHPVGRLKPNDFGLFDMLGNAYEWCHDTHQPTQGLPRDFERIENYPTRAIRGGSFLQRADPLLKPVGIAANQQLHANIGFRPVKIIYQHHDEKDR